ncbi:uncharacterized protein LOC131938016 [Physella acuta]|uniref:uncharacterized protein LOC131938016 n=1 Tax=Physella acuta TaxID=109671 RepID=UPI0027DCC900|nr:uncharacterized protein LOC131938016 [Physella acuta]XP_059151800.1 uncharacterized protein LOC131938016 [Physella acuta]
MQARAIQTLVVFDTETTGLPSPGNQTKITELCFIAISREELLTKTSAARVLNKLILCFNPRKNICHKASKLSGLYNDALESQRSFACQTNLISIFLQNLPQPVCLVAHNGNGFDYPLLVSELNSAKKEIPRDILCVDSLEALRAFDGLVPDPWKKRCPASSTCAAGQVDQENLLSAASPNKATKLATGWTVEEHTSPPSTFSVAPISLAGVGRELKLSEYNPTSALTLKNDNPTNALTLKNEVQQTTRSNGSMTSNDADRISVSNDADRISVSNDADRISVSNDADRISVSNDADRISVSNDADRISVSSDNHTVLAAAESAEELYFNLETTGTQTKYSDHTGTQTKYSDDLRENTSSLLTYSFYSNVEKSDSNVEKSDSNVGKSDSNVEKSDSNVEKSDSNVEKSDSNVEKSDSNAGQGEQRQIERLFETHPKTQCEKGLVTVINKSNDKRGSNPEKSNGKKSYKLSEIYRALFGQSPLVCHTAEDDCLTLLKIIQWKAELFCKWCDEKALPLTEIDPMY